jgi:putative ABC transport system permease protein
MSVWKEIGRRAMYLGRRGAFDRELDEEIRFHLDSRVEELEKAGMAREEALAQARREFGSRLRAAEETRSVWRFQWIEDFAVDLRHAARSFLRSPSFALTAVGCLALGIAANTVIFSLVNSILLRELPYPDADRLAMVRFMPPNEPDQKFGSNSGTYFFIREHNRVFERMGGLRLTNFSITTDARDADPTAIWVLGGWVSPGLTDTMGVTPRLGRWFTKEDSPLSTVISDGLWQRMFGGSPDVLGKKLVLDLGVLTIVGVMPPGFQTLNPAIDLWRPQPDEDLGRALRSPNRVFNLFARLKPGATMELAQADMDALVGPLSAEYEMNRGWKIKVDSLRDAYFGHLRQPLLILQGAVMILLIIACANVGGLLLARANTRYKELALRAVLGSSRARIIRQLLAEIMLLSLVAGVTGVALGWAGLRLFSRLAPSAVPTGVDVTMDLPVTAFALVLSLATGLMFGMLPALQVSRPDLIHTLHESSRSATAGGFRQRLRSAFVVLQVALALVLLIGAALLTHSLLRLKMVQPGFTTQGLVTFQVPFSRTLYRNTGANTPTGGLQIEMTPKFNALTEQIRERIGQVPEIQSATFAMTPPLGGIPRRFGFKKDGMILNSSEQEAWSAEWYPVGPGYLRTLKLPLVRGREFEIQDSSNTAPVAIINETLARRFFANEDPIGKRIQIGLLYDEPREIVGIVGDVRQDRYQYQPQAQMYVPYAQVPAKMDMSLSFDVLVATYIVRTNSNPAGLVPLLRRTVAEVDKSEPVINITTVEQYAAGQLQDLRHYAALLGIFGGISILLSFIGLFGIMAHAVSQRTNEIGLRVALGATSRAVLALIARQGLAVVGIGMALGLAASVALTRVLARFLWGVTATDPLTFLVVLLAMAVVAALACYLPARRALRIDPMIALRFE